MLVSAALALLAMIACAVVLMVGSALLHHFHVLDAGPQAVYRSALWCVLLAVAAAIAVFCRRSDTTDRSVLFGAWRVDPRWYVLAVLAALGVAALGVLLPRHDAIASNDNVVQRFFAQAGYSIPAWILAFAYLSLVVPVVEEILFRRAIYALLARWTPWIAFAISVALFTVAHPMEIRGPVLLIGLATAYLYQCCGSLLPGIVCHGLANLAATVVIAGRVG